MQNGGKKKKSMKEYIAGKTDRIIWVGKFAPFLYTQAFNKQYGIFLAFLQNICFSNDFLYANAWKQKSSKLHFAYKAYLAR